MNQMGLFPKPIKNHKAKFRQYDALALTRLSKHFILRDFLFSTESAVLGLSNLPEDTEMVIRAGQALCEQVLEPIQAQFGRFSITFGYQCREAMEYDWSAEKRRQHPRSSNPHQWDRGTFGNEVYARVDILPYCVEDGEVGKSEFARWCMMNLDIDLLMQWHRANIFCITISPRPRRVWIEWGNPALGQPMRRDIMGTDYWRRVYPYLPKEERPKYGPSCTGGSLRWSGD